MIDHLRARPFAPANKKTREKQKGSAKKEDARIRSGIPIFSAAPHPQAISIATVAIGSRHHRDLVYLLLPKRASRAAANSPECLATTDWLQL